jgi:CHASE2 domain-containing sensor protein
MFMRRVLVLNAFVWPPPVVQYVTWGISVCSGLLFWVTLNSLRSPLEVQLATGILSTILAWITYVLLVNERLQYPSRQQQVSLFFHIMTEALILLQVRLVVMSLDACEEE